MKIQEKIKENYFFLDGAMGTILQKRGLKSSELPESWNVTHPDEIIKIHKSYLEAGSDMILTNTFGANPLKTDDFETYILKGIENAKKAIYKDSQYVGLDIGPSGKLLKPLGDLDFEDAVESFAKIVRCAEKDKCDCIYIETMNDPYEMKAAVLAAKENSSLPVFATFVIEENGKTMTGCDIPAMVALLEGLRVDALGINCSLGADQIKKFVPELVARTSIPVIIKPNAGLPCMCNGVTEYDSTPNEFLTHMEDIARSGAVILGGCCGTTPEHIKKVVSALKNKKPEQIIRKDITVVSSYSKTCDFEKKVVLIGERINPTGKPKLKNALRENDLSYILNEAVSQEENGADMLDVNVGLPEIDEKEMLVRVLKEIQSVSSLPLQIDTSNSGALEAALRIYNGKALINSVNGTEESMNTVFPLAAKYGGVIIALTLDENGIPDNAEGRADIARKILRRAKKYGIDKKDLIVDPLCLTVSSNSMAPSVTIESIKLIKNKLGLKTSLGISNVSFGLPSRDIVNSTFFAMALNSGLDAVIMNPYSDTMKNVYYSYNALSGIDTACEEYISYASSQPADAGKTNNTSENMTLEMAIIKGLREDAKSITNELLKEFKPLEIVDKYIIPALDKVGYNYEKGVSFLPQLLMSAETANVAFDIIKGKIPRDEKSSKGEIIVATVKGDIHDIGKNIVKVVLQNYGFVVYDLGKDVDPYEVLRVAKEKKIKLVGLSALMTTTVPSMEKTIEVLKEYDKSINVMVGGAVLNEEYAKMIKADKYAKDAMEAVRYAQSFFKK